MEDNSQIEKIIIVLANHHEFAKPKDKLTMLIDKFSDYLSDELSEEELEFAVAAKMPDVPKYEIMKNL